MAVAMIILKRTLGLFHQAFLVVVTTVRDKREIVFALGCWDERVIMADSIVFKVFGICSLLLAEAATVFGFVTTTLGDLGALHLVNDCFLYGSRCLEPPPGALRGTH